MLSRLAAWAAVSYARAPGSWLLPGAAVLAFGGLLTARYVLGVGR